MGNVHPPGSGQRATEGMEVANDGSADICMEALEKDNSNSPNSNLEVQVDLNPERDLEKLDESGFLSPTTSNQSDTANAERTVFNQNAQLENENTKISDEPLLSADAAVASTNLNSSPETNRTGGTQNVANQRPPTLLIYQYSHLLCGVGKQGRLPVVACDGDQPLRFSVDPPLPEGLRISRKSGTINGSPTKPCGDAPSRHTVTASNRAGSTTCGLAITVLAGPSDVRYAATHTETDARRHEGAGGEAAWVTYLELPVVSVAGAAPLVFCLSPGADSCSRASARADSDELKDRAAIDAATGTIRVTHVTTIRDLERLFAGPRADSTCLRRFTVTVKNAVGQASLDVVLRLRPAIPALPGPNPPLPPCGTVYASESEFDSDGPPPVPHPGPAARRGRRHRLVRVAGRAQGAGAARGDAQGDSDSEAEHDSEAEAGAGGIEAGERSFGPGRAREREGRPLAARDSDAGRGRRGGYLPRLIRVVVPRADDDSDATPARPSSPPATPTHDSTRGGGGGGGGSGGGKGSGGGQVGGIGGAGRGPNNADQWNRFVGRHAGMGLPNTLLKLLYRDVKHGPRPDRTFTRAEALARIRVLQLRPHRPGPPAPRPKTSPARPARPGASGPAAAAGVPEASSDSDADPRPANSAGPEGRAVDPTSRARPAGGGPLVGARVRVRTWTRGAPHVRAGSAVDYLTEQGVYSIIFDDGSEDRLALPTPALRFKSGVTGPGPGNVEVTLAPGDAGEAGFRAEETVARLVNVRRTGPAPQAALGKRGLGAVGDSDRGGGDVCACVGEGSYRSRDAIGCRARLLFDNGQWYCGWVSGYEERRNVFSFTLDDGKVLTSPLPFPDIEILPGYKGRRTEDAATGVRPGSKHPRPSSSQAPGVVPRPAEEGSGGSAGGREGPSARGPSCASGEARDPARPDPGDAGHGGVGHGEGRSRAGWKGGWKGAVDRRSCSTWNQFLVTRGGQGLTKTQLKALYYQHISSAGEAAAGRHARAAAGGGWANGDAEGGDGVGEQGGAKRVRVRGPQPSSSSSAAPHAARIPARAAEPHSDSDGPARLDTGSEAVPAPARPGLPDRPGPDGGETEGSQAGPGSAGPACALERQLALGARVRWRGGGAEAGLAGWVSASDRAEGTYWLLMDDGQVAVVRRPVPAGLVAVLHPPLPL